MSDVLLLGAARSGIGALAACIAGAADAPVTDVSASLGLLHAVDKAAIAYRAGLPDQAALPESLAGTVLRQLGDALCAAPVKGKLRVFSAPDRLSDCPNMRAARLLMKMRPGMRAVIVWRQGVDLVNSRLRAFPETDFASHCLCWATAMAEMDRLRAAFPKCVLLVEQAALRQGPAAIASQLAGFLELPMPAVETMKRVLEGGRSNQLAAELGAPVHDAAKTGWSMAEIALFRLICGKAAAAHGHEVNLEAAERLRPLDLVQEALRHGRTAPGVALLPAEHRHEGPALVAAGTHAGAGLRLSPLNAGGRRQLSLHVHIDEAEAGAEFGCEIVEALSRRPLLQARCRAARQDSIIIDEQLPPHGGVVDIMLIPSAGAAPAKIRARLTKAELSYL